MSKDLKLFIEKMYEDAIVPKRMTDDSSGVDVYAHSFLKIYNHFGSNGEREVHKDVLKRVNDDKSVEISYMERILIGTGLKMTTGTPKYDIQVRPRSGLALKKGLTVLNAPGTIDNDYTDEVGVILINLSRSNQIIKLGDRIAQIVVAPVEQPKIEVVASLPTKTDRGGGYGSTGEN